MGKFIITKKINGQFQFNLKSNNGLTILNSVDYASKENCENAIETVKLYAQDESNFEYKKAAKGQFYFTLKAANELVIGISLIYSTEFARGKGIAAVQSNAFEAAIEDKTRNRVLAM
jgi:uncharacterized protein YegP (UPF0339 family)